VDVLPATRQQAGSVGDDGSVRTSRDAKGRRSPRPSAAAGITSAAAR